MTRQRDVNFACLDIKSYYDYKAYGLQGCVDGTGYIFMTVFQLIYAMIILNLFVAVVLEGFQNTMDNEESYIKPDYIENFNEVWMEYDKNGVGLMRAEDIMNFMNQLQNPLGWQDVGISDENKRI